MCRPCVRGGWWRTGGRAAAAVVLGAFAGLGAAQGPPIADRGELLYTIHCIACHGEQLHWRDGKVASDWSRLKAEVRRWQAAARLRWSEDDIVAVARYLNETIYHLPQTGDGVGGLPASGVAVHASRLSR
jgi:mono/diheme cytochrome c family protein